MRYLEDESTYILSNFTTGDTVTITIYKLSDNSKVIDAAACSEISTTGRFKYSFSQAVATKTEYLWIMTNSIEEQQGKIILGGYPDGIKDQTDKMNFTGDDIKATLDGEKVALSDATEAEIDRILTATEVKQFTINDAAATLTKFITDLTETANTFWPRAALLMTSGQNKGQIRGIKNYNGSTKEVQIQTPLSYAPANGDTAIILPARKFLTPDVLELADAVWDELKSGHVSAGSFGKSVQDIETETDKIQPEIIDKKDGFKATGFATPGDVKCGGGGGGGAIIERPDIWKPEEKLKLIEDIKKIYKMINELGSLQSAGVQNVKNNIESLKNSLIKLIKEEVTLLVSLKKTISEQPQTDSSDALADSVNQLIAKWDSVQKSILKPSDLFSLDNKLDDLTKVMVKSLSNKDLEKLVLENEH